jgi:hypothetical protein
MIGRKIQAGREGWKGFKAEATLSVKLILLGATAFVSTQLP